MNSKFIEICLETFPKEMPNRKIYQSHYFYTTRNYTHNELVEIMKKIDQKFIFNSETGYMEVDLIDLIKQFSNYEIYEHITIERYMFDSELN